MATCKTCGGKTPEQNKEANSDKSPSHTSQEPLLDEGHILEGDHVRIFVRYITKNGKRIYPKNGKCFSWLVPLSDYRRKA